MNVRVFSFALLLLCGALGAAENDQTENSRQAQNKIKYYSTAKKNIPYWYTLEKGKKSFREGDYGAALSYFEEARDSHAEYWARQKRAFIALMTIQEVRKFGDSLSLVEQYAEDHLQADAKLAIETLRFNVDPKLLNDSVKTAVDYLDSLKAYPDAEYWIGEVYRIESETEIALNQYNKTLELINKGDKKDSATPINVMYRIAEMNRELCRYNEMEAAYKLIIETYETDKIWSDNEGFVRNSMKKTLEKDGINEFLIRFRHTNPDTDNAHKELGYFYYSTGRYDLAERHLMLSSLIESTTIIEGVKRDKYNFVFTTLDNLMDELARKQEIKQYIEDSFYFKKLYYLASALNANGKPSTAKEIWRFVSHQQGMGADEWAKRSQSQLHSPYIEVIITNP